MTLQAHTEGPLDLAKLARAARPAGRRLARLSPEQRSEVLRAIARSVHADSAAILAANQQDIERAIHAGLAAPMVDRLRLDPKRLASIVAAVESIAAMPDPVGAIVKADRRPNGLVVERRRIPLGVILIVYESRPNVTVDAAALCLRSGNAVILRGGSEAFLSNQALGRSIARALVECGLPAEVVQLVPTTDRDAMRALLQLEDDIDLCIPRGGEALIRFVAEHARVPVIKHYRGNCHVYVDAAADFDKALAICDNAKRSRPGVCNATETILVDAAIAERFVPALVAKLADVEFRGDARARAIAPTLRAATDEDFHAEFLDLVCALGVVDGVAGAIAHIQRFSSNHTEAIVTEDHATAERFLRELDSSTVLHNASTRFADGGELGLGAEIGISTTKLHAYGPMGAEELTTTQFVVRGDGQVRS